MRKFIYVCIALYSCLWANENLRAANHESGAADSKAPTLTSPEEGRQNLSLGWKYFSDGNYEFAANSFALAKKYPESALDARFGLGLSQMKLGNKQKAREEFAYLVDSKYKTSEVLPPFMWLLIESKKYRTAGRYLSLVERGQQKDEWSRMIRNGLFKERAELAISTNNSTDILAAVKDNHSLLSSCQSSYIFFNSARELSESGLENDAIDIHNDILNNCPEDKELRGLTLEELSRLLTADIITSRLIDERERYGSDRKYAMRLDSIEASALMAKLEGLDPASEEAYSIVRRINSLNPEDAGMTARMSWDSLNLKHYDKAYKGFSDLLEDNPENTEYALGLSYSLLAQKRYAEALSVSGKFMDKADDFRMISLNAHKGLGRQAYHSKDYKTALKHYSSVLVEEPGNDEALSLTAWSHYNSGNFSEALPYFTREYQNSKKPDNIMPILSIYEASDPVRARAFESELASSDRPEAVKALADYYGSKGRDITAAQVADEGADSCYYNADKPRIETSLISRSKSGDSGLSKLSENISSLKAHFPVKGGRKLSLSVSHIDLDSGNAPSGVFAGSFYNTIIPDPDGMTNTASLMEAELRYDKEGRVSYSLALGVSPSGGEASASPTFSLSAGSARWAVGLYRSPVRESILSYSGLRDPYSPGWWGGVLKSGVRGSISSNPTERYIYFVEAGYDSYEGENVIDNNSYSGTFSVSRPFAGKSTDIVIGGFITAMGFDKNTNHFTFGHGGYFSPQSFIALGPSLRLTSKPCKTLWFDVQASVSYMTHETDPSPHYPLDSTIPQGQFAGDSFSGMGSSFRGEVRKLLSRKWSAGISVSADNSSEYDQWSAGVQLRYLSEGRSTVRP